MDVPVSKHDELDTYLPAFRATVTEAKAGSVMCAYNSINGQPPAPTSSCLRINFAASGDSRARRFRTAKRLSTSYDGHHSRPTQAEASAHQSSARHGQRVRRLHDSGDDDHDYKPYLDAVKQGFLKESDIDVAVTRLFTARMKLGMFDPPEMVPYSKIDESQLDGPAHRAMARKMANESMVLLKNDGVAATEDFRAENRAGRAAMADQTKVLLGNYNGKTVAHGHHPGGPARGVPQA